MKLIATTAMAALLACPVWADKVTVDEETGLEVTVFDSPTCEDANKYNTDWNVFRNANDLPKPIAAMRIKSEDGQIWFATLYEKNAGYRMLFGYKDGQVCLLSTTRPVAGPV